MGIEEKRAERDELAKRLKKLEDEVEKERERLETEATLEAQIDLYRILIEGHEKALRELREEE